jgi:6-phosphogluconolactonase
LLCAPEAATAAPGRGPALAGKYWVFVGTYNGAKSKGIYRLELDATTGKLSEPELAVECVDPSFLAMHPSGRFLYAVSEIGELGGKKTGGVRAFALERVAGKLTALNEQPSKGSGPCHIVVDRQGRNALVANYGGGSAACLPIGPDGKLGEATGFVQHSGGSVNPDRQKEPHAHSINLDPNNRFAFVADLGLDQVLIYRFDPTHGTLKPNDPPHVAVEPGAGPRHFAFHPSGKFAYVINELGNTITAMSYDPEGGVLKKVQTVSTLPKDFTGKSYTAEVVVHPTGRFVYGSNRGHNSIAIFKADPQTGKLTPAGHQAEGIKTPRNFNIDPTGRYLLVANQDADSIVIFTIDPERGDLKPTGQTVKVPMPVCIKFLAKPEKQ